jgi:glycosyltransferase involved in cell wall biosynthesis
MECLNASTISVETLVVDNASTDRTLDILAREFPAARVLEQDRNLGFGQANNVGMRYAHEAGADYVFLLNQDAYLYPGTIRELVEAQQSQPQYGILSPLQLNGRGTALDAKFSRKVAKHHGEALTASLVKSGAAPPRMLEVRFVNAAAWLISRECLDKTGLFHPLFYHYGEDNNYCSRAQYLGFKTGVYTGARVLHDRDAPRPGAGSTLRKITQVPLYTVLDIRKSATVARIIACWKLAGYLVSGITKFSPEIIRAAGAERRLLKNKRAEIKAARREMKSPYRWQPTPLVENNSSHGPI